MCWTAAEEELVNRLTFDASNNRLPSFAPEPKPALPEWEMRMLKKRTSMPVEIQPVSDQRAQAILMGSSTSKKTKRSSNSPQSRKSSANAEASRRSSLREQRTQLEVTKKRGW
jgi:hypothetical protein